MQKHRLTADEIEIRAWAFVVIMVTLILVFIVGMLLCSVTFVTQPIKSMAPIDQAYTKMLNDIVLLIVGGIGGIMSKRAVKSAAEMMATQTYPPSASPTSPQTTPTPCAPTPTPSGVPFQGLPVWANPPLDESWTPGPPPTTPPDYLDPAREQIAQERELARNST